MISLSPMPVIPIIRKPIPRIPIKKKKSLEKKMMLFDHYTFIHCSNIKK